MGDDTTDSAVSVLDSVDVPKTRKRKRTDLTPHLPTLIEHWNQGMTEHSSAEARRLRDKVARETGLLVDQVNDWINNWKKKTRKGNTGTEETRPKAKVSQRKKSGFSRFLSDMMKGPATEATNKEKLQRIHTQWKGMDGDAKKRYQEQADQVKAVRIEDLTEEEKLSHSNHLVKRLHSLSEDFKNCGLEMAVMLYCPTPSPGGVQFAGTPRGRQYLTDRAGKMHFDFLTAMNDGNTGTASSKKHRSDLQAEVRATLNEKYAAATNTKKKFPYKDFVEKRLVVHGVPEGVDISHIASLSKSNLQLILQEREKIVIEVPGTSSNATGESSQEMVNDEGESSQEMVNDEEQATGTGELQAYDLLQEVQDGLQNAMTARLEETEDPAVTLAKSVTMPQMDTAIHEELSWQTVEEIASALSKKSCLPNNQPYSTINSARYHINTLTEPDMLLGTPSN
ncbi:hypothetical protein Bbelb_419640 [Branchiostoma belcheri]|nr:hypothetical protein Bbelb_419640 [Branchiostoma belcheri]